MNGKKVIVQIGSINRKLYPGGISSYFESVIDYLNLTNQPVISIEIGEKVGVKGKRIFFSNFRHLPVVRMLMMRKLLRDIDNRFGDVVFVAHYLPTIFLSLPFLFRSHSVFHFHGCAFLEAQIEGKNKLYVHLLKHIERLIYPRFQKIIVLSEYSKRLLTEHFKVNPERVIVVPYSFNSDLLNISAISHQKAALLTPTFRISCVRRLYKRMGIIHLLEAVKSLLEAGYALELFIIGDGALFNSFNTYIEQHYLQGRVFLLGKVSDELLHEYLASSHLTVVPSIDLEGFGIAIIESLQRGTPCLGTPVGGIPEILHKIDSRLLIAENSPDGIRAKLKYYLDSPASLPSPTELLTRTKAAFAYEVNYPRLLTVYHG